MQYSIEESQSVVEESGAASKSGNNKASASSNKSKVRQDLVFVPHLERDRELLEDAGVLDYLKAPLRFDRMAAVKFTAQLLSKQGYRR